MGTPNQLEIEIKIRIADTAEICRQLTKMGFRVSMEKEFEQNIVFDTGDFRLGKKGCLLRLRKTGSRHILTFKRPSPARPKSEEYKIREEIETQVENFEATRAILSGLGFEMSFIYEKYREVFSRGIIKIMVDETPIGNFIEIEAPEAEIDAVSRELGFSRADYIVDNYRTLFYKAGREGYMTFT